MKSKPSSRLKGDKPEFSTMATQKQSRKEPHRFPQEGSIGGVSDFVLDQLSGDVPIILPQRDIESLVKERLWLLNPGGGDVPAGAIVNSEADERTLLDMLKVTRCKMVISIRPGHRFLLERDDGCVTPSILREIGKENIILVATPKRLASLNGSPLIVDTGDPELDEQLCGFYSVSTGHGKRAIYKAIPSAENLKQPET